MRIRNGVDSILPLEKLKIPVETLSLFASEDRTLWTETLILEREQERDSAVVRLDGEPTPARSVERVASPRVILSKGFLLDAFGGVFAREGG